MANKKFKTVAAVLLSGLLAFGAVGCNHTWNGNVTLTDWGQVIEGTNGGAVVETENYVYFINGEEVYTANNDLGTPVKGALMAVNKADLAGGNAQAQVVVPKLFAAGDTDSGVYIFGDRAYFATPSTQKNTSGEAATDHLDFCSMKLDGTDFTVYFTISGNSTEHRFVAVGERVHAYYYDSEEQRIVDYDLAAGTSSIVNEGTHNAAASYVLLPNEVIEKTGLVALYTVVPRNESAGTDESYNVLYGVKAGEDQPKELASGTRVSGDTPAGAPAATYAVSFVKGDYAVITETRTYSSTDETKTYGVAVADLYEKGLTAALEDGSALEYKSTTAVANGSIFASLTEVYAVDGDYIVEYSFNAEGRETKTAVAKAAVTTLLSKQGDEIYYISTDTELCKIDISAAENEVIRVSEGTVVSDWFPVEFAAGYAFFLDSSTTGLSYMNYAALDTSAEGAIGEEDTDDDDEIDLWYVKNVYFLGERKESDKTQYVTLVISALSTDITQIEYDYKEEKWTQEEQITEARAAYDALTDEQKADMEDDLAILERYENYLAVSKMLHELTVYVEYPEGGYKIDCVEPTEENKADLQAKIDAIEKRIEELEYTSSDISVLVSGGMGAMQALQEKIDALNEAAA